jgi:surfactin synthase thioesterase subunit
VPINSTSTDAALRGEPSPWVPSRWVPLCPRSGVQEATPLFCLPHAGGGASAFRPWLDRIPGVAVLPLQPPGREGRLREAPFVRMEPLVAELAEVVVETAGQRPFGVYGHSLGALVAFELVRELRRRGFGPGGAPGPVHLFVSGCIAPQHANGYDDGPSFVTATLPELAVMLGELGGTPDWLLRDPEAMAMILPAIRGDFSVKEAYRYHPEPPLGVPVTVLSSTHDPRAPLELQHGWREQTAEAFLEYTLQGGHFAIYEQAAAVHERIAAALLSPRI